MKKPTVKRRCEECGVLIPRARLKARPDADLCVACKTQYDEKPLRAKDLGDNLASLGELTSSEAQRMLQSGGG